MPEAVFWDTAAFVALGNRDDRWHAAAAQISADLEASDALLITTDAVLTETANLFSRAAWRKLARQLVDAVWQSVDVGLAEVVRVDENLWRRGWQLFCERPDKNWSLTDCISFVVMQERGIARAFTADRHFEQAGFVRLLQ